MDNEQERVVKQPQKSPKTSEFLDTGSDNEQGPAVNYHRCVVMYSTEDEEEPAVKKLQKASKIHDEGPQETSPGEAHKESSKAAKMLSAASCTLILTSGVGKQYIFKASDKTGKFYLHYKQT